MRRWMIGCCSLLPALCWSDGLRVENGNVVLATAGGLVRQLTASGHDRDPALSPDGRWAIFVRDGLGKPGDGKPPASEVRIVATAGGPEQVLIRSGTGCGRNPDLQGLSSPQFLSDSRRFVFLSQSVATSDSAHLASRIGTACAYVAPANSLDVVRSGEHRDRLVLSQHRYFLAGGSYDWYWLVTLDGREVGAIGQDEEAVRRFLDEAAEDGTTPAAGRGG